MLLVPGIQMVGRGVRGSLDGGTSRGVGTHHSRVGGGVNVEFNESSTATSGQATALCGHQTARQYAILPPFLSLSLRPSYYLVTASIQFCAAPL